MPRGAHAQWGVCVCACVCVWTATAAQWSMKCKYYITVSIGFDLNLQDNASYIPNSVWLTTIGAVTRGGLTPLGLAVREGKLDTIKYLIMECNVDVNGKFVQLAYCASRRSRRRDTVKLTVCVHENVCVCQCIPTITTQRNEN